MKRNTWTREHKQINGTENEKNILDIDQTGNTSNIEFRCRFQNLKFDSKEFSTFFFFFFQLFCSKSMTSVPALYGSLLLEEFASGYSAGISPT